LSRRFRIRWFLCRRRHNVHYADLQIMPMPLGHRRREAVLALKGAA
jgi:hypothetical protein